MRREDRGMYQCFVYNDQDGAQGTAELKISGNIHVEIDAGRNNMPYCGIICMSGMHNMF